MKNIRNTKSYRKMTGYIAQGIIRGRWMGVSEEQELAAWQFLIDSNVLLRLDLPYQKKAEGMVGLGVLRPRP